MGRRKWQYLGCVLAASTCSSTMLAQTVVSERTEVREITSTPIGANDRAGGLPAGIRGVRGGTVSTPATGAAPMIASPPPAGAISGSVQVEISVLAFHIPDFDPSDQLVYQYHVGMISESGGGNGTAYPDENGDVQFERVTHAGEMPMQTYLYGVHVDTGEVEIFIDIDDITVNQAVRIINNVSRVQAPGVRPEAGGEFRYFPFPAVGNERSTGLHGNYLTVSDLMLQIRDQTGCRVGEDELGVFYLDYCN